MKIALRDLADTMGSSTGLKGSVHSYSIDSRTLVPGDLFFAIRGEVHDGHQFVPEALARGAKAAVVSEDVTADDRLIRVSDTLQALQSAAQWACAHWSGTVIGVTGSAGKTSTKDIIASLVEVSVPTGRTAGNFNNHIGLPLSLLRVPDHARAAVLEYGMNHAGEIRALTEIARPRIAVVTNVGYAHVENFEDGIDGVARAKRELVEALPPDGTAVLNSDDERVRGFSESHTGGTVFYGLNPGADVRAEDVRHVETGTRFRMGATEFQTRLHGEHAVRNILAGIAVASLFGLKPEQLTEAVAALAPGKMRGERFVHRGIVVINDCYNSNPEAAREMLGVLRGLPARRRIAVLGEMLELGRWSESLHREIGSYAARCGIAVLVGIRGEARALVEGAVKAGLQKDAAYFFQEPGPAGAWLRELAQPGDAILFKGSRGTRVEQALEAFLA
jgi:UDP-N-acetylmuramoyl-tripeptide--D-alanyl-D-alanine ligase